MKPPDSLLDLLKRTATALDRKNIPYAISGALALMIWGFVRATRDIDLIISVPAIRLPEAIETILGSASKAEMKKAIEQMRKDHFMTFLLQGIELEVFVPVIPYHDQVISRRIQKDVEGVPVWFVTAEDLVVLKMIFQRTKDLADVKGVVATLKGNLNRDYVRKSLSDILPARDQRLVALEAIFDTIHSGDRSSGQTPA